MHLDVNVLNNFYYHTRLGQFTKRRLQESVQKLWGQSINGPIVGFGFTPPVLSLFFDQAHQMICLMPGQQGVMSWPTEQSNCSVLVEETSWPIATSSIERLLILHGLETSEKIKELLQEIWRTLSPTSKVIFVVPNRTGWWARSEMTPFGQGRPYSIRQLTSQLKANRFKVERYITALYAPPFESLHLLKTGKVLEDLGEKFGARFGAGIILLEAGKQIHALAKPQLGNDITKSLDVLEDFSSPKPI